MRRAPIALAALGLWLAAPVAGQTPRVGVVLSLSSVAEPNGAHRPRLQVKDLFADPRWSQALDRSFPIRLSFRLEIWRSREGWVDDFQRAAEWSTIIQREPLEEQYVVTQILRSGPLELPRFSTREELDRWVGTVNLVDALPQGTGTFYYSLILRITALSDEDMEELERFLGGQTDTMPAPARRSIGRSWRRFLLRAAGLPWEELEAKSPSFVVRR